MSTTAAAAARAFLPFHRASIGGEEARAVLEVLQSAWLTTGPRVREFEAAFARYVGAGHALAVSSCTAALHLALSAIDIQEGDEVIVPTMTFAASGATVLYHRARPVLVDCGPKLFHVDPNQIEAAITSRAKAIMPVHFAGSPCDMDAILAIARKHGLKVIEDAAHALPSRYNDRMVGALGDITCFSFYATKTLTTGEGGMATTENPEYADRMRILGLHGISRDAWKRYTAEGSWRYDILEAGYKYNMTDLQAAIGLTQLAKCDVLCARRAAIARHYRTGLAGLKAFEPLATPGDDHHAWHLFVIQVKPEALRISRDKVIEELKSRGIGTSVHFIPLHLHSLYQRLGYRTGQFPNAESHFTRAISLPIFPDMRIEDIDRVVEGLTEIEEEFAA
jgi:perosamine synthetase